MKPARYQVRVHGIIFCISALFGLALFAFDVINRGQLFAATAFLVVFGEVVVTAAKFCGPVLEQRIKSGQ